MGKVSYGERRGRGVRAIQLSSERGNQSTFPGDFVPLHLRQCSNHSSLLTFQCTYFDLQSYLIRQILREQARNRSVRLPLGA